MLQTSADCTAAPPLLHADEIHVWHLPHERSAGRSRLLRLLAWYAGVQPQAVRLESDRYGRPSLAPPHDRLHFNWSHSGDVALVAIARQLPELGIDVEMMRPRPRAMELAQRFFSAAESGQLAHTPPSQQLHRFLQLWTAKEAVLKAHGRGVSYGLHRVEFTVDAQPPTPRCFSGVIGPARDWHLRALDVDTHAIAHLAWRGAQRSVCCFRADADSDDQAIQFCPTSSRGGIERA